MKQGKTEKAVFAKLSTEKVELSALDKAQDAQRIFLDARTRASNMALEAADYMEREMSDLFKLKSAVEADLNKLRKMQQELGFETKLESKLKAALDDIDGYFSSADKWVNGLRASAKGKF
jgi:hypothetical protein